MCSSDLLLDRYRAAQAGEPAFPEVSLPDFKIGSWGSAAPAPAAPANPASVPAAPAMTQGAAPAVGAPSDVDLDAIAGFTGKGTTPAAPMSALDRYINEYKAQIQSDREDAKYRAMITAGGAMLGGTSPFAAVNIGHGIQAGMADLQASAKQAGLSDRTMAQMLIGSERFAENERMKQQALQERREESQARLAAGRAPEAVLEKANIAMSKDVLAQELLKQLSNPLVIGDPVKASAMQQKLEAIRDFYVRQVGGANPPPLNHATANPATRIPIGQTMKRSD